MQQGLIYRFLVRWIVSSLGLWLAAAFLSNISYNDQWYVIVIAGFILAIINSIIRPAVVLLSLPAIMLTLGLFMVVINGLMVLLVAWLYSPLEVSGFWTALLAGLIIGLVNFLVTTILESVQKK
jgi:putative membrane protein